MAVADGGTVRVGDVDGTLVGLLVTDAEGGDDGLAMAPDGGVLAGTAVVAGTTVGSGFVGAVAEAIIGTVVGVAAGVRTIRDVSVGVGAIASARAGGTGAHGITTRARSNATRHHARHRVTRSHHPICV